MVSNVASCLLEQSIGVNHHRHDVTMLYHYDVTIQNISSFENLELNTLNNMKITGKYWLHFVVLTSWDKIKLCSCLIPYTRPPSGSQWWGLTCGSDMLLTPLGTSGGPCHVTTQFYYFVNLFQETWKYICIFNNFSTLAKLAQVAEIIPHGRQWPVYPASA